MQCADVTERLLVDEPERRSDLDLHVAGCPRCAHVARGLVRLHGVLGSTLIIAPPFDLQRQLAQLAVDAARPQLPWWSSAFGAIEQWNPVALLRRPQTIAVQGLAVVMVTLASWQILGWLSTFQPVVGDVAYAMELVAASPAAAYMGGLQLDLPSLGLWSLVAIAGWLISEEGLIGRRLSSVRLLQT